MKKKKKMKNAEKLRRDIQSQRTKYGYCCIGNYNNWRIG